ncbi:hypothetical protein LCGC14_1780230, partial [marine sediment metagenome]
IYDEGTLIWSAGFDLRLNNGGSLTIETNGSLDDNGQVDANIDLLTNSADYIFDNEGFFSVYSIDLNNTDGSLNITGSSDINVLRDFKLKFDGISVTNNLSGILNVDHDLGLESDNTSFVNNGTIYVGHNFKLEREGSEFVNNAPLIVAVDFNLKGNNSLLTNNDTIINEAIMKKIY